MTPKGYEDLNLEIDSEPKAYNVGPVAIMTREFTLYISVIYYISPWSLIYHLKLFVSLIVIHCS